jgi:hypothetical protein
LTSFVTVNPELPNRPALDTDGSELKVCAYNLPPDQNFGMCNADEVYWEQVPIGDKDKEMCYTRDKKQGAACENYTGRQFCTYHTCSKVTPDDCPVLPDGVKAVKATAANPNFYDGHKISCSYRVSDLAKSCKAATQFASYKKQELGLQTFDNWFDPAVMNAMCLRQETDPSVCPLQSQDYKDSSGNAVCSTMLTCDLCKEWANSNWANAKTQSDNLITQWCGAHPGDPSCGCVNKVNDDVYVKTQQITPAPPGCWYKACVDKNFVKDLVKSDDRTWGNCPTMLCQNVLQVLGGEVDINQLNMKINCSGGPGPNPTPPTPGPTPVPVPVPVPFIKKYEKYIPLAVAGGGAALLLLGMVIPKSKK